MKAPQPLTITQKLKLYFKALKEEVKKALLHKPKPKMTVKQCLTELKGYNKNKLITILTNIIAEKKSLLPICNNKKEVKSWSKREIISMIIKELVAQVNPEFKKAEIKKQEEKVKYEEPSHTV